MQLKEDYMPGKKKQNDTLTTGLIVTHRAGYLIAGFLVGYEVHALIFGEDPSFVSFIIAIVSVVAVESAYRARSE